MDNCMVALNLTKGQKITIQGNLYSVGDLITRDVMKDHETRVKYYTYDLQSDDSNVTYCSLDCLNNKLFIFHLTKKVEADICKDSIKIGNQNYIIQKVRDEIYIDPTDGNLRDAKCYDVLSDDKYGSVSELHIHGDNNQIFYLTLKIEKGDILIHDKK